MPGNTRTPRADTDLLLKGVICAVLGLLVLLGPRFLKSPALVEAAAGSAVVGWFALVLGCAFIVQHLLARRKAVRRGTSKPD